MLFINSAAFWWSISIFLTDEVISSDYIAYLIAAFIFNVIEFVSTIYTAIQTRKGHHIEWWFFGPLAHVFCKKNP
jgi:hypothetical protein